MTEKQYVKYLWDIYKNVLKMCWCPRCKQREVCDEKLKKECVIRYETKSHKDEWTFEKGLKEKQEEEKEIKEKIKEVKKKLKERKSND